MNISAKSKLLKSVFSELNADNTNEFELFSFKLIDDHPLHHLDINLNCNGPVVCASKRLTIDHEKNDSGDDTLTEDSYISGSPLKMKTEFSFISSLGINQSVCETQPDISHLSLNQGRYIISMYNIMQQLNKTDRILPLWVYCNGEDSENTYLISSESSLGSNQDELCMYMVSCTLLNDRKSSLPDGKILLNEHVARSIGLRNIDTNCCVWYNLSGHQFSGAEETVIMVKIYWNDFKELLHRPSLISKFIVEIKPILNVNGISKANIILSELNILKSLIDGLKSGVIQWCNDKENVLMDQLDNLLSGDIDYDKTHDFTGKLWLILKDCSSQQDLLIALRGVFKCLLSGTIQPTVHSNNRSRMAQYIRDSYFGKMSIPDLQGVLHLELLVEIGLEKLARDYLSEFLCKELFSVAKLDHFIKTSGSFEERYNRLECLHHVLELILSLEDHLTPDKAMAVLCKAARESLDFYETHGLVKNNTFQIQITSFDSFQLDTAKISPYAWKTVFKSTYHDRDIISAHIFTKQPLISHMKGHDSTSGDNADYYYYTTIKSVIC